jgi:hypothetical protein
MCWWRGAKRLGGREEGREGGRKGGREGGREGGRGWARLSGEEESKQGLAAYDVSTTG